MVQQIKQILANVLPIALGAATGLGAAIYTKRKKSSQETSAECQFEFPESKIRNPMEEKTEVPESKIRNSMEEQKTEIPDSKIRIPMEETFLDMKDATISAAKKILPNPEDSKKD